MHDFRENDADDVTKIRIEIQSIGRQSLVVVLPVVRVRLVLSVRLGQGLHHWSHPAQ